MDEPASLGRRLPQQFARDYGSRDASFYTQLTDALEQLRAALRLSPDVSFGARYHRRLRALAAATDGWGYGFGETVTDVVADVDVGLDE